MSYTDSTNGITYTLSGTSATVSSFDNSVANVTIPETFIYNGTTYTVNAIAQYTFDSTNASNLVSIDIPATITAIPNYCFYNNTKLETVQLNGLVSVGNHAFRNNRNLHTIDFSYVRTIGTQSFANIGVNDTTISFPNITNFFGDNCFSGSFPSIERIILGENYTEHKKERVFPYIQAGVEIVFQATETMTFSISDPLSLNSHALVFENSPEIIFQDVNAFSNVTDITIGSTTYTKGDFFVYLGYWYADMINGLYYQINSHTNNTAGVAQYYSNINTSPVIADTITRDGVNYTVKSIVDGVFRYNTEIVEITIPSTIRSLPKNITNRGTFEGCTSLTKVNLLGSVTRQGGTFASTSISSFDFSKIHPVGGFSNSKLVDVVVPEGKTIERDAFYGCSELKSITVYNNIPEGMCEQCTALETVLIGSQISSIGKEAFYECSSLKSFTYLGTTLPTIESEYTFYNIPSTASFNAYLMDETDLTVMHTTHGFSDVFNVFTASNNLQYKTQGTAYTAYVYGVEGTLSSPDVVIDGDFTINPTFTVTTISGDAFQNQEITSIVIPSTITSIEDGAFVGTNLKSITFEHTTSLPTMGSNVFDSSSTLVVDTKATDTSALTSLSVGNVVVLNADAFTLPTYLSMDLDHYYYVFYTLSNSDRNAIQMRAYDHDGNLLLEKKQSFTFSNAANILQKINNNNPMRVGNINSLSNVDVAVMGVYQQGWNAKQQKRLIQYLNKTYPNIYSNATNIFDISSSGGYLVDGEVGRVFSLQKGTYVFDHSLLTNANDEILFRRTSDNTSYAESTNVWFEGTIGETHAYKILKLDENTPDLQYYTANGALGYIYVDAISIDVCYNIYSNAYHNIPFVVYFVNNTHVDKTYTITGDTTYLALTPNTFDLCGNKTTDISFVFSPSAASGNYTIELEGVTATIQLEPEVTRFTVTVEEVDGSDMFLIDNSQNKTLDLIEGNAYIFDLSYTESYTFGLATDYDAAGNTQFTTKVSSIGINQIFLEEAPSQQLYYYEPSNTYMGNYLDTVHIDICYNTYSKAYYNTPFIVSFNNVSRLDKTYTISGDITDLIRTPSSFDLPDRSVTDISFVFTSDASAGTYVIEVGDVSASIVLEQAAQRFTVTVEEVDGADMFLIDNSQNKTLVLVSGNVYVFDLSYTAQYDFQFATDYDAAGSTEFTTNIESYNNSITIASAPSQQLYYYEPSNTYMGNYLDAVYIDICYNGLSKSYNNVSFVVSFNNVSRLDKTYTISGDITHLIRTPSSFDLPDRSVTDISFVFTSDASTGTYVIEVGDVSASIVLENPSQQFTVTVDDVSGYDSFFIDNSYNKLLSLTSGNVYVFDLSYVESYNFKLATDYLATNNTEYSINTFTIEDKFILEGAPSQQLYYYDPSNVFVGNYEDLLLIDVCYNTLSKAYNNVPFVVSFNNFSVYDHTYTISGDITHLIRTPSSFSLPNRSITDISFIFTSDASAGTYVVEANNTSASIVLEKPAQHFTVTVEEVDGADLFLIDNSQNKTLDLVSGNVYTFDLSYTESYDFGLATDYDGSGNTDFTTNISTIENVFILDGAPSDQLYYYDSSYTFMGNYLDTVFIDICYNTVSNAYNNVPFVVSFNNVSRLDKTYTISGDITHLIRTPSSFDLPDRSVTDISFVFTSDASAGTYVIEIGDVSASIVLEKPAQHFTVTVEEVDGADLFLIDNSQNKTLDLVSGNVYTFDLSYTESYDFGLATDYDGSGNTDFTTNISTIENVFILDGAPSDQLYYYDSSYTFMGNYLDTVFIDICYNTVSNAYNNVPFVVSFNNVSRLDKTYTISGDITHLIRTPSSFDLPDRSVTDISFVFTSDASAGTYVIEIGDVSASIALPEIVENFTVTVENINGYDMFLIDNVQNKTLNLVPGNGYQFDLSYTDAYTFGLATSYDASNNTEYTTNVTTTSSSLTLTSAPSEQLYYYETSNPDMGNYLETVYIDICYNGLSNAYSTIPFVVSFNNTSVLNKTFSISGDITDLTLTPSDFTIQYRGTTDVSFVFGTDTSSGVYVIEIGEDISASFIFEKPAQQYTVTIGQDVCNNDIFLIDNTENKTLYLSSKNDYIFDLSYVEPYTFGLATTYDASGNTEYTRKVSTIGNSFVVEDFSSEQLYYYETSNPDMGNYFKWEQRGLSIYTDVSDTDFGNSIALSASGTTIAIGADFYDTTYSNDGLIRVFDWSGNSWIQKGSDIIGTAKGEKIGTSVGISSDGNIIASGGNEFARVYYWDGSSWLQKGSDITHNNSTSKFGNNISLSSDGDTIAVGDIDRNSYTGACTIYKWNGSSWSQRGSILNGPTTGGRFSTTISVSSNGEIIAIGEANVSANSYMPIVQMLEWSGTGWVQKGSNLTGSISNDGFGESVSVSSDGTTVAISAPSYEKGIVKVFRWNGVDEWTQIGNDIQNTNNNGDFGKSVSLSSDGNMLAIGHVEFYVTNGYEGRILMYSYDGADWSQKGSDILGEQIRSYSGRVVSISSDGNVVAHNNMESSFQTNPLGNVRVFYGV